MGVRTNSEVSFQIGQDNTLDDFLFERDFTQLLDTLDHAASHKITLIASEQDYDVPFGDVADARIVYIEADGEFEVVFGGAAATAAQVDGAGAAFGTILNGETFLFSVNGTALAVTFVVPGDTTLAAVINRINSVAALSGFGPVAFDNGAGQLRVKSTTVGAASEIDIAGGTALAKLGHAVGTTNGTNSQPGTSNLVIARPADPSGSDGAAGVKAFFFATIQTTSIRLTNPSTDTAINVRVGIAGDLTAPPVC